MRIEGVERKRHLPSLYLTEKESVGKPERNRPGWPWALTNLPRVTTATRTSLGGNSRTSWSLIRHAVAGIWGT